MHRHPRRPPGHPLRGAGADPPGDPGALWQLHLPGGLWPGLRHDNGSHCTSSYFQEELRFLGIESSPAYVRGPEGNGVAERFIRTLKEQLLWVQHFETVGELERGLQVFKQRYKEQWLVSKHDYRTPQQARALLALESAA